MWRIFKKWKSLNVGWQLATLQTFYTEKEANKHMEELKVLFYDRDFIVKKINSSN